MAKENKAFKSIEPQKIFTLKLHESLEIETSTGLYFNVIKVPGGWIYTSQMHDLSNAVFVPIFKKRELEQAISLPF